MKLTLEKHNLVKALYTVQSVVQRKTTMPILSNLLLSTETESGEKAGGRVAILGTDLEISALAHSKANIDRKGSIAVNARIFSEIIKELPEGELTIQLGENDRLEIRSTASGGKSNVKMIGVSADEYPGVPGLSLEPKGTFASQEFSEMLSKTVYAVSSDDTRFNLNGVCFEITGDTLTLVATDGHRLALIKRPAGALGTAGGFTGSIIVPKKGVLELRKLVDTEENRELRVGVLEGFLVVDNGDAKVAIRLVDAEFPDYHQVIPKEAGTVLETKSVELSQALKRVALMVSDKNKGVRFSLSEGKLRISSSSPELGEAEEELSVQYGGEPLTIGFNALYMADFAQSLGEDRPISIEFHGENGPARLYSEQDQSYIGIVMPMRLQ